MKLYGFGLLRNGVKYDYCFQESLKSLSDISESIYLALGDSDDGTEAELKFLENLIIIPTIWDMANREGGTILSEQTNIALSELRKAHGSENDTWGFYLQCDEVLHEDDYELIHNDLVKAREEGCDAVAFRYLHFWQTHSQVAINKKWYPHEIRAIKINTDIESWGDAQGFRNQQKVYYSEARIFHYGHVREEDKYRDKKESILKLYHSDQKLPKYQKREKKFDNQTETLNFWGLHPAVMKNRIERLGEQWLPEKREKVYIVGKREELDIDIPFKVNADHLVWNKSIFEVPREERRDAIILKPDLIARFLYPTLVPDSMRSKLARPWSPRFKTLLKFYEKGIGVEI